VAKWLKLYAMYTFSTQPDLRHYTTLLNVDVLHFYLTLDLLQPDCSDLVSKWRHHTVVTTFLLRGHCQTCAGCPETIFHVSTGRHHGASARDTVAFLERESCGKRVVVYALVSVYAGHISSTNSDNFKPICHDN